MAVSTTQAGASRGPAVPAGPSEGAQSAVSWAAIIGGAFVMASVGLILLALGSGIGFASVSPWRGSGVSATTFSIITAVWLIVVQWLSAGLGGYLTGRLRTKWVGIHSDEVYFRDTAHGFLAWALAAVVTVVFLSSAASSVVSGTGRAVGAVGSAALQTGGIAAAGMAGQAGAQGGAQSGGGAASPSGYLVDTLFRSDHPDANANPQDVRAETTRILASALQAGELPAGDKTYLAQLIAARTGISQEDAQKRIDDVIAKAKQAETKAREAADTARKAATYLSFFTAFSMLIGAFIAAAAGALGGHHRDEYVARY